MTNFTSGPVITRMRHDTRRRSLTVLASDRITPNMLRLRLGGVELVGFVSPSPGDHIKIFVPDGEGRMTMRDYTPRRFNLAEGWLDVDFALHEAGPATQWALQARSGDRAEIGGPRGSMMIDGPIRAWLLVGDETALPSIARRIEELPSGAHVTSVVAIRDAADEQVLETRAKHRSFWVVRQNPTDAGLLLSALENLDLGEGVYVWVGAEAGVARAIRDAVLARGVKAEWMRAAGYWVSGQSDASVKDL